jgi:hypothetical protein
MVENNPLPKIVQTFGADLVSAMRAAERRPRARRRTRLAIATTVTTAVTTAAATAAVVFVVLAGHGSGVTTNALADPLARAARAALRQPSLFPRNDQYYYVRTEGAQPAGMSIKVSTPGVKAGGPGVTAIETIIVDRWQSASRTGIQRTRVVALHFESADDARAWRRNGGTKPGTTSSFRLPGSQGEYYIDIGHDGQLTRRQVLALPSSPTALYARLVPSKRLIDRVLHHATANERAGVRQDEAEYGSLKNFLAWSACDAIASSFEQGPMPPALRSGLFGALALIPGVTNIGLDKDLAGRTGAAITFTDRPTHIRTELIFDPETSALLGERQTVTQTGGGFRKGAVIENLAYLNEAVTSTLKIPHTKALH